MRKGEVRRQAILDASEKLFFEKGYLETTVDDVLTALQCSKGSFYHYFDSKLAVLTAICGERVGRDYEKYKNTRVTSTTGRLNALLYHMNPFRPGEEEFVYALLRLRMGEENAVMENALRAAQRALFKPELTQLLMILNETGAARIARPRLDALVFELNTAFYDEMCEAAFQCARTGEGVARAMTECVSAARFLWERALDLPYGSMEIVKLEEALPLLEQAVARLRGQ